LSLKNKELALIITVINISLQISKITLKELVILSVSIIRIQFKSQNIMLCKRKMIDCRQMAIRIILYVYSNIYKIYWFNIIFILILYTNFYISFTYLWNNKFYKINKVQFFYNINKIVLSLGYTKIDSKNKQSINVIKI